MGKADLLQCPITGQVGACPSAAIAALNPSSAEATGLSPKEQQANLWQSLLERNGHPTRTSSSQRNVGNSSTSIAISGAQKKSNGSRTTSSSRQCPELTQANSGSLSLTPSNDESSGADSESVYSGSETQAGEKDDQQQAARVWPTYDQVSAHVLVADYHESLTSGADQHPASTPTTKYLCPHGVVCQAKLEFFASTPDLAKKNYTGLLTPGTSVDHCLLRLSSALRPVDHGGGAWAKALARRTFGAKLSASQILPAAALKCFRRNHASGNLLLMGSKVGQPSRNFFEHALCTAVTEKIPALGMPFLRRFSRYSKYPLSLGLSEVCQHDALGQAADTDELSFPFALCLQPVVQWPPASMATSSNNNIENPDDDQPFDTFIDDIPQHVPAGTHLFDIYAAPTPESMSDSRQLQRIGKVISTSAFVYSSPTDGLTFRHQTKEDDLQLQPTWEDRMHSHIIQNSSDGTRGSVAKMTGWQIMEEHITERGDYINFEQQAKERCFCVTARNVRSVNLGEPSTVRVPGWQFCGFRKAHVALD